MVALILRPPLHMGTRLGLIGVASGWGERYRMFGLGPVQKTDAIILSWSTIECHNYASLETRQ